mmetsp:Transcript_343/g.40  ORF Transcript_343/g.40 Transcript_343/m.40 type:complete len:83 (+) Transcript_343:1529-1777(+)
MVEDGEARPYKSRGFAGKGYKFTSEESQKAMDKKKKRKKDFVFSDSDTDSEGGEEPHQKKADMSLADLIKEPKTRAAAMAAA